MTPPRASGRPSLADVAKQAGVSSQTVSRVVRGADVVAEETRDRVMAIVTELGYQPNLAARSLSLRRTGMVHVVPFGETLTLNQLIPLGVDGVVILGGHSRSSHWAEMADTRVPVVFVGQRTGLPTSVSSVGVDQAHGALLATRHLIGQGRNRLLHICGNDQIFIAE